MTKTTAGTLLRILSYISIALYVYGMYKGSEFSDLLSEREIDFDTYVSASAFYERFKLAMPFFFTIDFLFTIFYRKKDAEGRITLKNEIFPEFNYTDEREALVTGRAAKVSLSIIFCYTFIVLVFYGIFLHTIPGMIFATASIPIVGLLAYLVTYKLLIAK